MTTRALVRTTRPSLCALLSPKTKATRENTSLTGSSALFALDRTGTVWPWDDSLHLYDRQFSV